MRTPGRKAVRDAWHERGRTAMAVLAIALGIAAFGAVLSAYAILTRELNEGYLATNPAAATLWTDRLDDDVLRALVSGGGVRDAEARRAVRARIKAGPVEWRNLQLFVVRDYASIRISTLKRQEGAWPPGAGEILIERDALPVARARIGDTVTVRTAAGREQPLRVTGSVHDVGQAQARMEQIVYGYVTLDTLRLLDEEPYLDQVKIQVAGDSFDEPHVQRMAAQVKERLEALGHPVRRMEVPRPGEHPHADLMGTLLLAMAAFGLFALVLSGILVVNLFSGLMASQVRQIGVMKAIGGTHGQIAGIYMAKTLVLGMAAVGLAVPAGMIGGRALCRYMAVFLNFDIHSFAVPWWVYLLEGTSGVLVPLLAAARPVARGSAITVREALADVGVGATVFGARRFDRVLAGVGGVPRPLLLALRNSFRRRARLLLTVLTLAVAGTFFLCALNVRASMIRTLEDYFGRTKHDLTLSLARMHSFATIEEVVRQTPGIVAAEGWITTEASMASGAESGASAPAVSHGGPALGHGGGGATSDRFTVVGLPADTRLLEMEVLEGRALQPGDRNALVVNGSLASGGRRLKVGDQVHVRLGHRSVPFQVVGRIRELLSPRVAYMPRSYIEELGGHPGMANSIRLVLGRSDAASVSEIKVRLEQNLEKAGVRALAGVSKGERRIGFDQHMVMIYVFLIVMSCILVGVGGSGLMTTMSLNVLERRREMGVMRAVGASPKVLGLIVVAEGAVIGLMSGLLAALLAWPVSRVVGGLLVRALFRSGLDSVFELWGLFTWLAVSLVLGAAASFVPAWHAARAPVHEAIGYE